MNCEVHLSAICMTFVTEASGSQLSLSNKWSMLVL